MQPLQPFLPLTTQVLPLTIHFTHHPLHLSSITHHTFHPPHIPPITNYTFHSSPTAPSTITNYTSPRITNCTFSPPPTTPSTHHQLHLPLITNCTFHHHQLHLPLITNCTFHPSPTTPSTHHPLHLLPTIHYIFHPSPINPIPFTHHPRLNYLHSHCLHVHDWLQWSLLRIQPQYTHKSMTQHPTIECLKVSTHTQIYTPTLRLCCWFIPLRQPARCYIL